MISFWFYIKSRQEQKQEDTNDGDADERDVKQGQEYNDGCSIFSWKLFLDVLVESNGMILVFSFSCLVVLQCR